MQDLKPLELGKLLLQAAGDYDLKTLRKFVELDRSKFMPEIVNFRNNGLNTPLLMAAQNNKERDVITTFSYLLQLPGTDINAVNKQGLTALMTSAKKGHAEAVAYLLKEYAEFEILDESKKSAMDHAANVAVRKELQAAVDARIAAARLLVVKQKSQELHSIISDMIANTSLEPHKLQRLLGSMPYPEGLDYPNEEKQSPLMVAVAKNRADIVQILVGAGCDPTCLDEVIRR
jgi:ankyrin repeat protein